MVRVYILTCIYVVSSSRRLQRLNSPIPPPTSPTSSNLGDRTLHRLALDFLRFLLKFSRVLAVVRRCGDSSTPRDFLQFVQKKVR